MPTAQFLLLLALSPLADPGEDEAKTLQAIRTAVREQFTSIRSLELQFHYFDPEKNVERENWALTIDDRKIRLSTSDVLGQFPFGPISTRWFSFDGTQYFSISYDPADPSKIRSIYRSP